MFVTAYSAKNKWLKQQLLTLLVYCLLKLLARNTVNLYKNTALSICKKYPKLVKTNVATYKYRLPL